MTVSNTKVSSSFNGNGVTRSFELGFVFDENVSGLSIKVVDSEGAKTEVTSNYTIYNGILTYPTIESGLSPLDNGYTLIVERMTPLTQEINLVQQGPLDAEVLESGYDKSTLQIQEVASKKQDKLIAGENIIIDEDGTISATGEVVEGVNWGNIHGTLSNQTDLQNALDAKQATISDLETIRSGAALGATSVQPSQLENKADTDLSNVNNTGKSTAAGWAMPSSTASAVSLSTSSANTMTSAGWVIVGAHSDNIGFVNLQIGITTHKVCSSYTGGNAQSFNYYPVYTGETVNIATDGTGTIDVYVFVPCAGVN